MILLKDLFRSKSKPKGADPAPLPPSPAPPRPPRPRSWQWNSVLKSFRSAQQEPIKGGQLEVTTAEATVAESEDVVPEPVIPKAPMVTPIEKDLSQHGSKRLISIMSRLHLNTSEAQCERSMSELELPPPMLLQEKLASAAAEIKHSPSRTEVPTDYTSPVDSSESLSSTVVPRILVHDDPSGPSEPSGSGKRNVSNISSLSTQTMESQVSATTDSTIRRHPSHTPIEIEKQNHGECLWSNLVNFNLDKLSTGLNESSDPTPDGKDDVEPQPFAVQYVSTLYENQPNDDKGPSVVPTHVSKSHIRPASRKSRRHSSGGSDTSRCSQMCRLDPKKAAVAFNLLAGQSKVPITISPNDPTAITAANTMVKGNNQPTHRRILDLIRPVKSNMALGEYSKPPEKTAHRLRRSKTLSNLRRRARPMTSLRGRPLEYIARIGGHSYLILPNDLAPAPLQLPVCIVGPVLYLRQSGTLSSELFVNAGDMKAAVRLYDHFANQVLSVPNDEKIAMTMRVVGMPSWFSETGTPSTTPPLSVGLVFKELLAGLPDGILGSIPLYRALEGINRAAPDNPARARLVTLAIVAYTTEMQCALICGVFGFLSGLVKKAEKQVSKAEKSTEDQDTGISHRLAILNSAGLVRIFAPLLVGVQQSDLQRQVEQEIKDSRVMKMLLDDWREVNKQMRNWTSGYSKKSYV